MTTTWDQLAAQTKELHSLRSLLGIAEWDQQVMMPKAGAPERGSAMAALSGLVHDKFTAPRTGELLDELSDTPLEPWQAASVRELRKSYDRATKIPAELIRRSTQARSASMGAWVQAKQSNDFSVFAPHLETILAQTRETIGHLKTDEATDYDVLLDQFDPGSTVAELDPMFDRLAAELGTLIDTLDGKPHPQGFTGEFDLAAQEALHKDVVGALGFDFGAGRLDASEHPFTIGIHPADVRITTHLYPDALLQGLTGTIHETGHGMYEQGIPGDWTGLPVGGAASFGLHESQSRFWENTIGRSLPFCRWLKGRLDQHIPGNTITPEQLYAQANKVKRSLIRIFADEVTYNLHIIVRYKLERALLSGELPVADLPGAWKQLMQQIVGVAPDTDTDGCLQDVHWAGGMVAYFPSYTLGNLYAASLAAAMQDELPDMWTQVESGDFAPILDWLRTRVHARGHLVDAPEIVRDAVGTRDHVEDLVSHMWRRQGALYGAKRG